jgi:hypothetical protein
LDYFKIRNKQIKKTQNNILGAIVGLTKVMALHRVVNLIARNVKTSYVGEKIDANDNFFDVDYFW